MKLLKDPNKKTIEFLGKRILKIVEKNQEWMVKNPPALQWLMCHWENIYSAGRCCYGYEGIIKKGYECENNPKYEIQDRIDYINENIENVIYDAWGNTLDVLRRPNSQVEYEAGTWSKDVFDKIRIDYRNRKDTDYTLLENKKNKTLDEWVEYLTDKNYQYSSIYPDRRSVINHLLACYGTGYGWNKDGYLAKKAPSESDRTMFSGWELCDISSFPEKYQEIIEQIIYSDKVQKSIEETIKFRYSFFIKKNNAEMESNLSFIMSVYDDLSEGDQKIKEDELRSKDGDKIKEIYEEVMDIMREASGRKEKEDKNFTYYPFSSNYSPMTTLPKNVHQSYIDASFEIVEHVLNNKDRYKDRDTYKEAQKWVRKYKALVRKPKIEKLLN